MEMGRGSSGPLMLVLDVRSVSLNPHINEGNLLYAFRMRGSGFFVSVCIYACDRKRPLSARQDSPRPPQHAYCLVNSINPFGRDA